MGGKIVLEIEVLLGFTQDIQMSPSYLTTSTTVSWKRFRFHMAITGIPRGEHDITILERMLAFDQLYEGRCTLVSNQLKCNQGEPAIHSGNITSLAGGVGDKLTRKYYSDSPHYKVPHHR